MKEYLLIFLRGVAMGAADVVPGVSGGTIAFISGIYDRLLAAIAACTPDKLIWLLRGRIAGGVGVGIRWRGGRGRRRQWALAADATVAARDHRQVAQLPPRRVERGSLGKGVCVCVCAYREGQTAAGLPDAEAAG